MIKERQRYRLVKVEPFDARRGYRRCTVPGVGASVEGIRKSALADFWRDATGRLVLRVSRPGYVFHYEAQMVDGQYIPDTELDDFGEHVSLKLADWLCEPEDDIGEPEFG